MSVRRSTIRSNLFPSANSQKNTPSPNHELTFKGQDSTSNDQTNVYRVSVASLTSDLRRMRELGQKKIDQLAHDDRAIFNRMVELLSLTSVNTEYNSMLNIIEEVFDDYSEPIRPETVASYFRGCFVNDNFGGSPACSAICAGSVRAPDTKGSNICLSSVATLGQSGLRIDSNGSSDDGHIIVHIIDGVEGLTRKHINDLKKDGYKTITIYTYGTKGYTVKQSPIAIDNVIPVDKVKDKSDKRPPTHYEEELPVTNYWYNGWIWVIVIIIILLVLGFIFSRRRQSSNGAPGLYPTF